ncbi:hypothetical protein ACSBLW_19260 [Thioclava sp. FR2]|uniref:hypothetical protein n=1 Tax=Thioclava sp. FR2 TaxID=3445780 RepID=UPI003EBF27EE
MNMISPHQSTGQRENRREECFGSAELAFSRADGRGVLQAFNDVFLKAADLTPAEAMGMPYDSQCHDEMPKAIFQTMWKRLDKGLPAGVYLKNRAKGDVNCWVFAIIVPTPDAGFVSVHLRPSSEHYELIQDLYPLLRKGEQENGVSAEQSAAHLTQLLNEHGYSDYNQFEARALAAELSDRAEKLTRVVNPRLSLMLTLFNAARIVREERQSVMGVLDTLRLLPTNMRLISHRIEYGHGPLSTLSERYGAMADVLLMQLSNLIGSDSNSEAAETEALFACGIEVLLREAVEALADRNRGLESVDLVAEQTRLSALADVAAHTSREGMVLTGRSAARLARELEMLQRSTQALDSIRVMSRVEFGQMVTRSRDLAHVIQCVEESHKEIRAHLARLSEAVLQIEEVGGLLLRQAG